MKGKALRRALATTDAHRISGDIPAIVDTTELITPDGAQALLQQNKCNRPINWKKVEEYTVLMERGEWKVTAQGIVLDTDGNILTGQKRLWAVIYSGESVYMRVSRGNPPSTGRLLDRGTPQSSRDLATRNTGRKHSPSEVSIARAMCALDGTLKPSVDLIADRLERNDSMASTLLIVTHGTKKTRAVTMILAALCMQAKNEAVAKKAVQSLTWLASQLDSALAPQSAASCWGHGTLFTLAMGHAQRLVQIALEKIQN